MGLSLHVEVFRLVGFRLAYPDPTAAIAAPQQGGAEVVDGEGEGHPVHEDVGVDDAVVHDCFPCLDQTLCEEGRCEGGRCERGR